ncbi:alkyl hydroperoxide reductase subunit F, partial [Burkholderia gladioli]|nr:alkyl hydroperoxide reductase subunit F [Burkholderia gladioli]
MLDARIKEQLKDKLLRYQTQAVEIAAAFDPGAESAKLRELLDEIVSVSARLTLVESTGDDMAAPSFSIGAPGEAPRIRFCGVPTG